MLGNYYDTCNKLIYFILFLGSIAYISLLPFDGTSSDNDTFIYGKFMWHQIRSVSFGAYFFARSTLVKFSSMALLSTCIIGSTGSAL